jgi:serine/threonine protein kinase
MTDCYINNKYQIINKLGEGRFGCVYKGVNIKTKTNVAIKFENLDAPMKLLQHETKILNYLYSEGSRNVPAIFWYGAYGNNICTVMSMFERSLYDCAATIQDKIYLVVQQCLIIVSDIHSKYVIHRDIKPQNIMIREGKLYFIDFGLSTFYVNEKREHLSNNGDKKEITGTPKWASVNLHNGCVPSRRDDLISLGYIFLFLINKGSLPWDNISVDALTNESEINVNHPKNLIRMEKKSLDSFISHQQNEIFINYIKNCYDLSFDEHPDYELLNDILKNDINK